MMVPPSFMAATGEPRWSVTNKVTRSLDALAGNAAPSIRTSTAAVATEKRMTAVMRLFII